VRLHNFDFCVLKYIVHTQGVYISSTDFIFLDTTRHLGHLSYLHQECKLRTDVETLRTLNYTHLASYMYKVCPLKGLGQFPKEPCLYLPYFLVILLKESVPPLPTHLAHNNLKISCTTSSLDLIYMYR